MSFIPINFLPISKIEKDKQTDKKNNTDNAPTIINEASTNMTPHEEELLHTYLNTLKILKSTNEMLRSENKLLFQELNRYKKKIEDES